MNESDAKTKWCPMRRMTELGNVRMHNSEPNAPFTLNCIGSGCMMWRSKMAPESEHMALGDQYKVGYCGLAGMP